MTAWGGRRLPPGKGRMPMVQLRRSAWPVLRADGPHPPRASLVAQHPPSPRPGDERPGKRFLTRMALPRVPNRQDADYRQGHLRCQVVVNLPRVPRNDPFLPTRQCHSFLTPFLSFSDPFSLPFSPCGKLRVRGVCGCGVGCRRKTHGGQSVGVGRGARAVRETGRMRAL